MIFYNYPADCFRFRVGLVRTKFALFRVWVLLGRGGEFMIHQEDKHKNKGWQLKERVPILCKKRVDLPFVYPFNDATRYPHWSIILPNL